MRTLLVGLVCALSLVGATYAQPAKPAQSQPLSAPAGRYQMFFSPLSRADTYLVDTQTGRMWERVVMTTLQNDPEVWVPADRFDSLSEMREWAATKVKKQP